MDSFVKDCFDALRETSPEAYRWFFSAGLYAHGELRVEWLSEALDSQRDMDGGVAVLEKAYKVLSALRSLDGGVFDSLVRRTSLGVDMESFFGVAHLLDGEPLSVRPDEAANGIIDVADGMFESSLCPSGIRQGRSFFGRRGFSQSRHVHRSHSHARGQRTGDIRRSPCGRG